MSIQKFCAATCVIGLAALLTAQKPGFAIDKTNSSIFQTEEQAIYALNNQGAALATRKNAAEEIIGKYVKSSGHHLLAIIQNPKESKPLQNHVINLISDSKSPYLLDLLEKQSLDLHTDLHARKSFLYCLHKADLKRSIELARNIAENRHDDESLRFDCIGYLSKDANEPDNVETVKTIFLDKNESLTLRKAAFFTLESLDDKNVFQDILNTVLMDTKESQGFRLLAIEKLDTLKDAGLQNHLVQVFFDAKETTTMRQEALNKLAHNKEKLVDLLPKFKNLYRQLKFGDFKESVRQLINDLEKIKKKQVRDSKAQRQQVLT